MDYLCEHGNMKEECCQTNNEEEDFIFDDEYETDEDGFTKDFWDKFDQVFDEKKFTS